MLEILKDSGINIRKLAKEIKIPEQRIYAWINKGSRPKQEDEEKVIEYLESKFKTTNQSQSTTDEMPSEYVISILISRVSQLLSEKSGRSSAIEAAQIIKDAEDLKKLKS